MARVQDEEVGDGTTSVAVLASELLRQAEKLIDMRIHPQTIIAGWRKATDVAKEALKKSVRTILTLLIQIIVSHLVAVFSGSPLSFQIGKVAYFDN